MICSVIVVDSLSALQFETDRLTDLFFAAVNSTLSEGLSVPSRVTIMFFSESFVFMLMLSLSSNMSRVSFVAEMFLK